MSSTLEPALLTPTETAAARLLILWHLLSLDAPTIATLWTCFLARADGVHLPVASPVAMFLAVWMLYAADRLLDARLLDARPSVFQNLEARHLFHHRHRPRFLTGIALASAALAALLPRLEPAAIRLYLIEGAFLVAWFVILHATRSAHRLPKEIAVGLFFAAAVFIPTVAREPGLRLALLPAAILFAALCGLNCLFIYAWEHGPRDSAAAPTAHPTTRLALRHLVAFSLALIVAGAAMTLLDRRAPWPIAAACALSAGCLLTLHRRRRGVDPTILRAAADLALLTPLLFLPFAR